MLHIKIFIRSLVPSQIENTLVLNEVTGFSLVTKKKKNSQISIV